MNLEYLEFVGTISSIPPSLQEVLNYEEQSVVEVSVIPLVGGLCQHPEF